MRSRKIIAVFLAAMLLAAFATGIASAEEKTSVKGKIKAYDLDAKTLVIVTEDGKEMTFTVEGEKALKKLDDRLFKDDEVKVRYIIRDGKNIIKDSNDLRGTKPGC